MPRLFGQETPGDAPRPTCSLCEKLDKNIRGQNELNVSMLGQMKDVMQQLVEIINLLREMLVRKVCFGTDPISFSFFFGAAD